jgi:hypothetical protein
MILRECISGKKLLPKLQIVQAWISKALQMGIMLRTLACAFSFIFHFILFFEFYIRIYKIKVELKKKKKKKKKQK